MWQGVYQVIPVPAAQHAAMAQQLAVVLDPLARADGRLAGVGVFNLGEPDDYRVPDGGLLRPGPDAVYIPTAALVLEIVSTGDEIWEKLGFYAARGVQELLIVDPDARSVDWLGLTADGEYEPIDRSGLIELSAAELAVRLDWPE